MSLTKVAEYSKKVIIRETRRQNQKYAKKMMASAIAYKRNTITISAMETGAKFIVGMGIAPSLNKLFTAISSLIESLR